MSKNTNEKLALFIEEGPIWDALNHLQNKRNSRYGAYCALIELLQAGDALDDVCATGSAMYLAEQLVGQKVFRYTMVEAIRHAIQLDTEDGDLTASDGAMLQKLLKVSIS